MTADDADDGLFTSVAGKEIQERYKNHLKIPLPTELVVVAGATLASHFGELNRRFGSSVSGHIPTGFIPPQVPSFGLMPRVALDAVPLAIIRCVLGGFFRQNI